jgi:hypothetical protein
MKQVLILVWSAFYTLMTYAQQTHTTSTSIYSKSESAAVPNDLSLTMGVAGRTRLSIDDRGRVQMGDTSNQNLILGFGAATRVQIGSGNLFIGQQSGSVNIADNNTFIGFQAGYSNTSGTLNFFSGYQAGYRNSSGNGNYYNGYRAGYNNPSGNENHCVGFQAGYSNGGEFNQFEGFQAGYANLIGSYNYFSGYKSGLSNTTGNSNLFIGQVSGRDNTTGGENSFLGYLAGGRNFSGSRNLCVGYRAGYSNIFGSNNTVIGYYADMVGQSLSNAGAIGYKAQVAANNSFVIGGIGPDAVNLGLGLAAPQTKFHIAGSGVSNQLRIDDSSGTTVRLNAFVSSNDGILPYVGTTTAHPFGIVTNNTYRITVDDIGNVGIGTTVPSQKLHVIGNICATGTIGACSDIRYKTHVQPLAASLSSLLALQPITYHWKKDFAGYTSAKQIGFSAQEVEQYFPELVLTDAQGYKSIDYSRMTVVIVEAFKEQQAQLTRQSEKMQHLERELAGMKQLLQSITQKQ